MFTYILYCTTFPFRTLAYLFKFARLQKALAVLFFLLLPPSLAS